MEFTLFDTNTCGPLANAMIGEYKPRSPQTSLTLFPYQRSGLATLRANTADFSQRIRITTTLPNTMVSPNIWATKTMGDPLFEIRKRHFVVNSSPMMKELLSSPRLVRALCLYRFLYIKTHQKPLLQFPAGTRDAQLISIWCEWWLQGTIRQWGKRCSGADIRAIRTVKVVGVDIGHLRVQIFTKEGLS